MFGLSPKAAVAVTSTVALPPVRPVVKVAPLEMLLYAT
jgi:hypothetical protein